jgi:hypothetical protein
MRSINRRRHDDDDWILRTVMMCHASRIPFRRFSLLCVANAADAAVMRLEVRQPQKVCYASGSEGEGDLFRLLLSLNTFYNY